jgi:hypothetical protein
MPSMNSLERFSGLGGGRHFFSLGLSDMRKSFRMGKLLMRRSDVGLKSFEFAITFLLDTHSFFGKFNRLVVDDALQLAGFPLEITKF